MAKHLFNRKLGTLEDVTKTYAGKEILHGVSFNVHAGESLLITGPSGSGKSTSIRMLADLERPTGGRVKLYEKLLKNGEGQKIVRDYVSFGQQDPALDAGFNVFENMISTAIELKPRDKTDIRRRAGALAIEFGITYLLEQPASTNLSGGERAKVALCRALVKRPEVLILDEPTSSVDPRGTIAIYERLRAIQKAERMTMVMVSHDDEAARTIADREIVIDSGRVIAEHQY